MSALKCKNCGGDLFLDDATQKLTCDSCGASQSLNSLASGTIFDEESASAAEINTYRRAMELLGTADTEKSLLMVAELFESVAHLFNASQLAEECRGRSALLRQERYYRQALTAMESDDPKQVRKALEIFEDLQNYKDSAEKISESKRRLEQVTEQYELRQKAEEAARLKRVQKKQQQIKCFLMFTASIVILVFLGSWWLHRPSNIKITITPDSDNYVTTKYNDYVFNYDVKIKNKSPLDVTAIEAEVYFEEPDGNVLIDADFNAGSTFYQSNPVARGKKSSEYTWSVTVSSKSKAETLYQYDFDDLKVKIKIKKLRYGEEKVRSY